jgi:hypothetical protein
VRGQGYEDSYTPNRRVSLIIEAYAVTSSEIYAKRATLLLSVCYKCHVVVKKIQSHIGV